MLCKNCNNTLSGSEAYCPFCGTQQPAPESQKITENETASQKISESSIFHSEPVYIYSEPPKEKKDTKTKLSISLVSIFLLSLLIIGGFSLAQYFNLTPAFSALFSTLPTDKSDSQTQQTTVEGEFDSSLGLVHPDISFKSTPCTVASEKGLPVKKGPDNAFAQIDTIPNGTSLQVIGKSLQNDLWVYVYVPSSDLYGWVSGSYISENSVLRASDTAEYTETPEN